MPAQRPAAPQPPKNKSKAPYDALVVGAGPAGLGTAIALRGMGVQRLAILDAGTLGQSFKRWPEGMRLITPSFTGNQYGTLDLNSIHPSTSPAFTLETEHPTGRQYADYLKAIADWAGLSVMERTPLKSLRKVDGLFHVETPKGVLTAKHVVWAAGEFHWPKKAGFPGSGYSIHNSAVGSWKKLKGERFVVIGGYESGIDAAFHLVSAGKKVTVIDSSAPWDSHDSDPSVVLSPYTRDRLRVAEASGRLTLVKGKVTGIEKARGGYVVAAGKKRFKTASQPILATGFQSSLALIKDLFDWAGDVAMVKQGNDESSKTPGLYLAGPALRHLVKGKLLVFCFIYKYRGRFPIVAQSIGKSLGVKKGEIERMVKFYKKEGMFLDDLSCCGDDCAC